VELVPMSTTATRTRVILKAGMGERYARAG